MRNVNPLIPVILIDGEKSANVEQQITSSRIYCTSAIFTDKLADAVRIRVNGAVSDLHAVDGQ